MGHDRRPQEDRHHVRLCRLPLLHPRRPRGTAAPHPTDPGQLGVPHRRCIQRPLHDARHHDDLPVRDAGGSGLHELPAPAVDRRAGRRFPPAQRPLVVALLLWRHLPVQHFPVRHIVASCRPRRRQFRESRCRRRTGIVQLLGELSGRRMVRLSAQRRAPVLAGHRDGLLGSRVTDPRPGLPGLGDQLHRHRVQHEGERDAAAAYAGVCLDDDGGRLPPALLPPDHRRGPVHGHLRPPVRNPVLRTGRWW